MGTGGVVGLFYRNRFEAALLLRLRRDCAVQEAAVLLLVQERGSSERRIVQ